MGLSEAAPWSPWYHTAPHWVPTVSEPLPGLGRERPPSARRSRRSSDPSVAPDPPADSSAAWSELQSPGPGKGGGPQARWRSSATDWHDGRVRSARYLKTTAEPTLISQLHWVRTQLIWNHVTAYSAVQWLLTGRTDLCSNPCSLLIMQSHTGSTNRRTQHQHWLLQQASWCSWLLLWEHTANTWFAVPIN